MSASHRIRRLALAPLLAVALAPGASPARAQELATVTIEDVRVLGDGRHELIVSALDASGVPVKGLEDAFEVTEDGARARSVTARLTSADRREATVTVVADATLFGGPTLADLQAMIRDLAATLDPGDRLRIVAAGSRARVREAAAGNVGRLVDGLDALHDTEPPRVYDALADEVRDLARRPSKRGGVALVVTRGLDGGSRRGAVDVLAFAHTRSRLTPVMLVVVGDRGGSADAERLRRLAANTGGASTQATSLYGLGPVLGGLVARGLDRWRVTFEVPAWKRGVPRHHVAVVVRQGDARRAASLDYDTADVLPPPWWDVPMLWLLLALLPVAGLAAWALARRPQRGLLVHDGDAWDGVWYEIFAFPVSIGAAAGNDLVLGGSEVSRNHAVLERRGKVVELADLNSENGSFVNGERVVRRTLADGDRLSFGPAVHMIYEARG